MKKPLSIHIIRHKEFEQGKYYSELIYKHLKNDITEPFGRGIGIPIFNIIKKIAPNQIAKILKISQYEKTAVLLFIDDNIILDEQMIEFINDLLHAADEYGFLIYPIAFSENAFQIDTKISKRHFIRLFERQEELKEHYLLLEIAHELNRLLLQNIRGADARSISFAPVKLFLSHTKRDQDGLSIAQQIKTFLEKETQIKTFFDANDIAPGYEFENEITENITHSVLVAIHTDAYSSSEWCKKEIIVAKSQNIPIIVVDAIKNGEKRIFPYLGNVPSFAFNNGKKIVILIFEIMKHSLRTIFKKQDIKYRTELTQRPVNTLLINPPELLTFIKLKNTTNNIVIYPDPPLGEEELNLLKDFNPKFSFLTPVEFFNL